jgi:hypothetical protein
MAEKLANDRFARFEREMLAVKEHCKQLRSAQSIVVPVETMAPEPFILRRPFQIVLRPADGEYLATFFDANIGIGGATEEEAINNLKALIVDTFDQLEHNEAILGPEPTRQLVVLRELLQRQN